MTVLGFFVLVLLRRFFQTPSMFRTHRDLRFHLPAGFLVFHIFTNTPIVSQTYAIAGLNVNLNLKRGPSYEVVETRRFQHKWGGRYFSHKQYQRTMTAFVQLVSARPEVQRCRSITRSVWATVLYCLHSQWVWRPPLLNSAFAFHQSSHYGRIIQWEYTLLRIQTIIVT